MQHRGAAYHGSQPGHSQGLETGGQPATKHHNAVRHRKSATDMRARCKPVTCLQFPLITIEDADLVATADEHICSKTKPDF